MGRVRAALEQALLNAWYERPTPPLPLRPLSALYGALAALSALPWRWGWRRPWRAPCPVVVVGNLIVGGAGKTPTVMALVETLRAAGWHPGVVSRGHGRRARGALVASTAHDAVTLGDEPWLIHRRTGVPLAVGERRAEAAVALLAAHPDIDVLVSDDGLQHHALAHDFTLWVFDERGIGNGAVLPAGPLRQAVPSRLPPNTWVLYNAPSPTTPLAGMLARRTLAGAVTLARWQAGAAMDRDALAALQGRPVLAMAGIASPRRFFTMLLEAGLEVTELPLPDHADLSIVPWPPGTADVVCTEKDATKLNAARCGSTRVWVVGLDFQLPAALVDDVIGALGRYGASHR